MAGPASSSHKELTLSGLRLVWSFGWRPPDNSENFPTLFALWTRDVCHMEPFPTASSPASPGQEWAPRLLQRYPGPIYPDHRASITKLAEADLTLPGLARLPTDISPTKHQRDKGSPLCLQKATSSHQALLVFGP